MNILILNWRDNLNPFAGGAERITHEYAAYWAREGHQVIWLSNSHPGLAPSSRVKGVQIHRIGPTLPFSALGLVFLYPLFVLKVAKYVRQLIKQQKFDLVIDEIHGLPFFTPLYIKTRIVLLVCEVAGPIWDKMFPPPFNHLGKLLEKTIYFLYRKTEIWAISKSTHQDILQINSQLNVKILPLGVHPPSPIQAKKTSYPSAVFLARLVKMKGLESAIQAAKEIHQVLPDFVLYVIGRGDEKYLKNLNAPSFIKFLGQVSESDKFKHLSRSHFLFHPSFKEGFGLTVIEAGLVGTPSIARSGSSLDELVIDKQTGFLFINDADISRLFISNYKGEVYSSLAIRSKNHSIQYLWPRRLGESDNVTGIRRKSPASN